jgi:cation transport ATPase
MGYRVVHAIAGRCRIQVSQLAEDLAFANRLVGLVEALAFVTEVRINPAASSLIVGYQAEAIASSEAQETFLTCIQKAWFDISVAEAIDAEEIARADWEAEAEDIGAQANEWERLGLPFLSLGLALLAAPLELPPLIVGTAIAGAAMPWFTRAAKHTVTERQLNVDFLDSLWITLHTLNGQYVAPSLKTSLMGSRAKLREEVTQTKVDRALDLSTLTCPDQGKQKMLPEAQVQVGDQIWVQAGERIPVDGYILEGTALIDEQPFLGTVTPNWHNPGESVYASTHVIEGKLCISVSRTGVNTQSSLVAHLIETEPVYDTQIAAHQAEFARSAVIPTLCLGGTIFAVTGNIGPAIAPFQLDFGSGIQLSLRTVILSALTYAAQNGIYIRSGRALEALAQIDTLVFDHANDDYANEQVDNQRGYSINSTLDASYLVTHLHQQNIAPYLMSSDSLTATLDLAKQLNIHPTQVYAEALPHHKAALVLGLRNQGQTVGLLGNSKQSAAAFACADVSIAYASQGEVLNNLADVVLLDQDLSKLIEAIAIAKRAMTVVYQNAALIVLPNLTVTTGGVFFGLHPVVNVITNNCTAFLAEFVNSARPLFPPPASL